MLAAVSLFVIITLSALVTKVAAIALMHTGLSTEIAKFQARSAYTGSGYTSQESEKLMNHPVRRKIVYMLMLIGNAGIITTLSSLMLTFLLPNNRSSLVYSLIFIVVALSALWFAIKSKVVDRWLSKMIDRALKKYTNIDVKDYAAILHLSGEYQISELRVRKTSWLAGKTLLELDLKSEGINVLGIQQKKGEYIGAPGGDDVINAGDVITMYGKAEIFKNIDARDDDFLGDWNHQKIVELEKNEENKNQF
ncbi:cation:proton antiporter regulatory subunit [Mesonia mobilis]|uniref:Potassium transporter TrkA n=1 Tax=Mesonia mobilis TaxID=369791 RepID=A0ABQ3BJ58_9FLAO|nr:TrkA C-terminal domain-containing protein [Mesonia mobilis]MBQ0739548.1 TrkA C-terminal domain-containing protein [Aquimarina celericrescens]GGZ46964.1 potassium transporter TrkA [Mesonia mobilis]